jgi:predicted 2-oxoglutarate/Fe(II)-dependent dioxygenase YbiX
VISKNVRDYVKVYKDFIDPKICKSAVEKLSRVNWQLHTYYDVSNNSYKSYEHELAVSNDEIPEKNELNKRVWDALHKYVVEDFKDFHEWFSGWNGFSYVRFNKYDPTTQMKLHCDHIHSMFDGERKGIPALTILGSLNNDYTGGEFVMWEDEVIDLPAGAIAVFPSNFMYPHEVRPVKTGVRYSYVSWAW